MHQRSRFIFIQTALHTVSILISGQPYPLQIYSTLYSFISPSLVGLACFPEKAQFVDLQMLHPAEKHEMCVCTSYHMAS
jgi:hypothetical protein